MTPEERARRLREWLDGQTWHEGSDRAAAIEARIADEIRDAEREAAASALEEAADNDHTTGSFRPSPMVKWLRARAAAIREGRDDE